MHARIIVILVTLKGNFLYFQVFSKILGLSTMTLSSSFSDPTWWQSTLVEPMERSKKYQRKQNGGCYFSMKPIPYHQHQGGIMSKKGSRQ